jgi:type II secretory pathway pseudopilin PulG
VLAIIAILFTLSTINLGKSSNVASLSSATSTLLADIRNEQIQAMTGDMGSTSSQQSHGVYIQSNSYILFADSTYTSGDTYNYNVNTNDVVLSTSFPSNQVVFNAGNGEVNGFTGGSNTITLSENGSSKIITINRFGATSVN